MELRLLWEVLRDRYKTFLLVTAGFLVFAILLIVLVPTVYQSTAYLMVKKTDEYTTFVKEFPQSLGALSYIDTDNVLGSLDLFMRNDVLVDRVIRKCGLQNVVHFSASKFSDPGLISILFRRRGIGIEAEKDTEVFSIKGLSPDIKQAQKIANTFLDEFLSYYADQKRKEIEKAKASYERKASELRTALLKLEQQELEYRTKNGVADFDLQKQKLIDRLKELDAANDELKKDLAARLDTYDALLETIARNPEYHRVSETITKNDLIQYYKQEIAQQESQLAAKKLELTGEHPEIRTIERRISAIKKLMDKEKAKIFSNSQISRNSYYDTLLQKREDNDIEVLKSKSSIRSTEQQIEAVKHQLNLLLENATGLLEMVRKKTDLDTIYKSVDQAINSLEAAQGIDISNFLVINRASIVGRAKDYAYAPDVSLFLALFGCAGLICGLVLIFLQEYADNSPRLFRSFEQLAPESRTLCIQGKKGWTLLAAELAERSPKSVAILYRGKKNQLKPFSERLMENSQSTQLNPFIVYTNGDYKTGLEAHYQMAVSEEELSTRGDELVRDLTGKGHTVMFLLPPLSTSSTGYRAGDQFDIILYVAKAGRVSFEEIRSDINFFYDRGWQDRVVGVFYAK